jgi:hypothetical protein
MRILVACEYSARVRDAFRAKGHDAWSCDVRECEGDPRWHIQGDVIGILDNGWDMLIGHPPCTFNTLAGIRWMYHPDDTGLPNHARRRHPKYPDRMDNFLEGAAFFKKLAAANIPLICLENSQPHGLAMSVIGKYTQKVQPWMFGDAFTKGACLWLKGLPRLIATHKKTDYEKIEDACHKASPGDEREKERSRTYLAIARAMAEQWGNLNASS